MGQRSMTSVGLMITDMRPVA